MSVFCRPKATTQVQGVGFLLVGDFKYKDTLGWDVGLALLQE
jgi:hypothetical protein